MKHQKAIIYDHHRLFSDSFSCIMERSDLFQSIQSFFDDKELVQHIISESPEPTVLFIDFIMDDAYSLFLINETRRLNRNLKVVVVSGISSPSLIKTIISYRPHGFISKSSGFDEIIKCLKKIEDGQFYLCPEIQNVLTNYEKIEKIPFTSRELQILQLFAQGFSIDKTAELVHLSRHTIVSHRRKMMKKAGCKSIIELLAFSHKHGLI
ncbi:response regulator transcription factor [Echinicola rosea]|uniref:response regulator transcription factor n=1 Tax=Echinicola rosea TaxID=1807691 RepID=UPI0016515307|nr:response regulator transcription factor [Echinicola rosea]